MITSWNYPTSVRFGAGAIAELPEACRSLGMQNPLLVTDAMLAKLDIAAKTLQTVKTLASTAPSSGHLPCPVGQDVDKGVAVLRAGGHDGVIAFGGGAAMDVAKAIALMAHQTR